MLKRVEVATLFPLMGIETIDEFAVEVVDRDGVGIIEQGQMKRDRGVTMAGSG